MSPHVSADCPDPRTQAEARGGVYRAQLPDPQAQTFAVVQVDQQGALFTRSKQQHTEPEYHMLPPVLQIFL